jgi:hypothetical protein
VLPEWLDIDFVQTVFLRRDACVADVPHERDVMLRSSTDWSA